MKFFFIKSFVKKVISFFHKFFWFNEFFLIDSEESGLNKLKNEILLCFLLKIFPVLKEVFSFEFFNGELVKVEI